MLSHMQENRVPAARLFCWAQLLGCGSQGGQAHCPARGKKARSGLPSWWAVFEWIFKERQAILKRVQTETKPLGTGKASKGDQQVARNHGDCAVSCQCSPLLPCHAADSRLLPLIGIIPPVDQCWIWMVNRPTCSPDLQKHLSQGPSPSHHLGEPKYARYPCGAQFLLHQGDPQVNHGLLVFTLDARNIHLDS